METCSRREIITIGAGAFALLTNALPILAAASRTGTFGWKTFLEAVAHFNALASDPLKQEQYVDRVEHLMQQLDYGDRLLRRHSPPPHKRHGFPAFSPVEDSLTIEVKLLSFDPGDSIEAHNPPEMTGVMACIAGKVAVETYDSIYVDSALRTATLRKRGTATLRERDTSTLTIGRGNIHQLVSKEGCEIIDIFTPPYSSNRVHATNWYDISNVPIANTPNLYEAHISHV